MCLVAHGCSNSSNKKLNGDSPGPLVMTLLLAVSKSTQTPSLIGESLLQGAPNAETGDQLCTHRLSNLIVKLLSHT